MKIKRALLLAIAALEEQQKPLHVDANLHEHYGAVYPLAVSASKQRAELREAAQVLRSMFVDGRAMPAGEGWTPPTPTRVGAIPSIPTGLEDWLYE